MRTVVSSQLSAVGWRRCALVGLFVAAICSLSCSIPNLESTNCSGARDQLKRFYSFHFGNEMMPSAENLKARKQYLTSELFDVLARNESPTFDYFTLSDEYPRTFRIGKCVNREPATPEDLHFQVQLFWRDDNSTSQKDIWVELVPENGEWAIAAISRVTQ